MLRFIHSTFVIRSNNGVADWVNVGKGAAMGPDTIEVFGNLQKRRQDFSQFRVGCIPRDRFFNRP